MFASFLLVGRMDECVVGISCAIADKLRGLQAALSMHKTPVMERIIYHRVTYSYALHERSVLLHHADQARLLCRFVEGIITLEHLLAFDRLADDFTALDFQRMQIWLLHASNECCRLHLLQRWFSIEGNVMPSQRAAFRSCLGRFAMARTALLTRLGASLDLMLTEAEIIATSCSATSPTKAKGRSFVANTFTNFVRAFSEIEGGDEASLWVHTQWVVPRFTPLLARVAKAGDASLGSLADALLEFVAGESFAPLAAADATAGRCPSLLRARPCRLCVLLLKRNRGVREDIGRC